jgi:hypothetical protein
VAVEVDGRTLEKRIVTRLERRHKGHHLLWDSINESKKLACGPDDKSFRRNSALLIISRLDEIKALRQSLESGSDRHVS